MLLVFYFWQIPWAHLKLSTDCAHKNLAAENGTCRVHVPQTGRVCMSRWKPWQHSSKKSNKANELNTKNILLWVHNTLLYVLGMNQQNSIALKDTFRIQCFCFTEITCLENIMQWFVQIGKHNRTKYYPTTGTTPLQIPLHEYRIDRLICWGIVF